jgi:SAM-dependent methyltransferase
VGRPPAPAWRRRSTCPESDKICPEPDTPFRAAVLELDANNGDSSTRYPSRGPKRMTDTPAAAAADHVLDRPFDRRLRRLRRDRAARASGDAFFLHHRTADELIERLDLVRRDFRSALVLGCGGVDLADRLRDRGLNVVAADPGARFAAACGGVQCDEDRLPFADGSFDLVVTIGLLDTVNDLPGALLLIRRALRPDGLFLGAFAGVGSLPRLRRAMRAAEAAEGADASPRLHPQIDARAAGDLLGRAGFALPVVDVESVTVRYSGLDRLIGDLRGMAATNLLALRARRPISRIGLAAAIADFASEADSDGKTTERFEIIHVSGWAPSPDQPRPARRGSATFSLADALRRKE